MNWFNQRLTSNVDLPSTTSNLLTNRAFIFALLIHLILALLLTNLVSPTIKTPSVHSVKKDKIKAIQSYLYHQPAITQQITLEKTPVIKKPVKSKPIHNKYQTVKSKQDKNIPINIKKIPSLVAPKLSAPPQLPTPAATRSKNSLSFSALEQLKQLQQQLDQQSINSEADYHNRARGKSIFNDLPAAVKHSEKQFTESEKREKMITHYGGGINIVKNDDGSCTLIQDLSNVGMTGIKARSSFKCGQTKMEKSYAAHMDKVLRKLGKKTR